MSRHHANVTWQSPDGTWSRGFYSVTWRPSDPDDEWGMEFGEDFQWVSAGHPTEEGALSAWRGINPGYTDTFSYRPDNAAEILSLDVRAAELEDRDSSSHGRQSHGFNDFGYNGPSKSDNPTILKERAENAGRELAESRCDQISFRLRGYSNDVTQLIDEKTKEQVDLMARAKAAGATDIDDGKQALLDGLRRLKEEDEERPRARWRLSFGYAPVSQLTLDARRELDEELAKAEQAVASSKAARARRSKTAVTNAGSGPGRVPSGLPAGGQFAARVHAESDTTLGAIK